MCAINHRKHTHIVIVLEVSRNIWYCLHLFLKAFKLYSLGGENFGHELKILRL